MTRPDEFSSQDRVALLDLIARIEEADGVRPVNESAELIINGYRDGEVVLEPAGGAPVAFGIADPREETIMLGVDPLHRRQGHGSNILRKLLQSQPQSSVWSFGSLPSAQELASSMGLKPVRRLLEMGRDLKDEPAPIVPDGYRITAFEDRDAEPVVAVNAVAFAHHPEQGKLTVAEFVDLTKQPWFTADGLLVARRGDEVAGFHWTKRHDEETGEVYVLAVDPAHSGGGLGRALLESGLAHLEQIGCTKVILYVEADQERVVRLYQSANFETINVDTNYRPEEA